MTELFKFIGADGSMGLRHGQLYALTVEKTGWFQSIFHKENVAIINPFYCPYNSWETFYLNWEYIGVAHVTEKNK